MQMQTVCGNLTSVLSWEVYVCVVYQQEQAMPLAFLCQVHWHTQAHVWPELFSNCDLNKKWSGLCVGGCGCWYMCIWNLIVLCIFIYHYMCVFVCVRKRMYVFIKMKMCFACGFVYFFSRIKMLFSQRIWPLPSRTPSATVMLLKLLDIILRLTGVLRKKFARVTLVSGLLWFFFFWGGV